MAGFQTIIDIHQKIEVNSRRVVSQQVARSGYVKTAQYLTAVPWIFTVTPHRFLYYPQVRDVIQSIDNSDRELSQTITFNSASLDWFTEMRGTATVASLASTPPANAQILSLNSNGTFKAGDFVQIGYYTYKVTEDSAGSSITIHRPLIGSASVGQSLTLGKNVTFRVVAEKCPTYKLTPMKDGAYVEWSEDFVFREYITP